MASQLIFNSVFVGLIYASLSSSLILNFQTKSFINLMLAGVFVVPAYLFSVLVGQGVMNGWVALALCPLIGAVLNYLIVYRLMVRKFQGEDVSTRLVISAFAGFLIVVGLASVLFGDAAMRMDSPWVSSSRSILGARTTELQLSIMLFAGLSVAMQWLFLSKTMYGLKLRALGEDADLARVFGIRDEIAVLWSYLLSGHLVGLLGILVSFDLDLTPRLGFSYTVVAVAAVLAAGTQSIPIAAGISIVIGLIQSIVVLGIGSEWQTSVGYVLVMMIIFLRPEGVAGLKLRRGQT